MNVLLFSQNWLLGPPAAPWVLPEQYYVLKIHLLLQVRALQGGLQDLPQDAQQSLGLQTAR